MIWWITGTFIAVALIAYVIVKINRRTCMLAFGQGVLDINELSWSGILEKYNSLLSPIRPMDAAAYKRGLEYGLLSIEDSSWQDMKDDFDHAYKSGTITSEGTHIREIGSEAASKSFRLRIPQKLEELILNNPESTPLSSKIKLEGVTP
jgi:hypothetical protein